MDDKQHINNSNNKNSIFTVDRPDYKRSKEDVWNSLSDSIMDDSIKVKYRNTKLRLYIFYGVAASLIILLGTVMMMRFYSASLYSPEGQQITHTMPDGSVVTLQPNTTLSYYPLWWSFSRRLVLAGEAFFDVKKGSKFIVSSALGKTMVLGTSFSVHARSNNYVVTCFSGKVLVTSFAKRSVVLETNFTAEVIDGDIKVSEFYGSDSPKPVNSLMFDYESVPLEMVIKDMELHFDVIITSSVSLGYNYTGYFSKRKPIEEVLYILCKPYGLKFIKLSDNKYHIIRN